MKKTIFFAMLTIGHAAAADVDFSQLSDVAKLDFLEATYEDALGACDRVVGRPNIAPYPDDALVVANRLFDLVLAPTMAADPLPAGTDVNLEEMLRTDAAKSGVWRTLYGVASAKYPTLSAEASQSEACNYLRAIIHGPEAEVDSLSEIIVGTINQ